MPHRQPPQCSRPSPLQGSHARRSRAATAAFCLLALLGLAQARRAPRRQAAPAQLRPPVSTAALVSRLRWRLVGPFVGGRVVAVAGVPGRPDLFYMGATGGGIWQSTNYGLSWINISDRTLKSASASIGALAVAPSNPKILYAGTGECDIRNTAIPGDGMFKSSDGGKTWKYAGLRATHTICAIAVDPHHPNVAFAASLGHVFAPNPERGVFKTTDGGKSWRRVLYVNASTGAIDVVMNPAHPQVLYAAMWQASRTPWGLTSGGPGSGIYETRDGGAHWTNLTHNPGLPGGVLGRIGISIAASRPRVLYAILQARHGGVFRSDDTGRSWRRVNRDWALRQRAFYYMSIFADPSRPDTVYVPEVDALWVSRDGGKNFHRLRTPHGDNHIVWINPLQPQILLEGNDGGATVSTDGGKSWSGEHNQPTGQFYAVSLDHRFPYDLYGAQQDEGSTEGPSASPMGAIPGSAWHRVAYGESTWVAPQPDNPNVTYGSGYFSILMRYDRSTGEYQGVSPWPDYQEGAASNELKYRFGWTHPILFSPVNPRQLLLGAQCVLSSTDAGRTWRRISPDLTRNAAPTEAPSGGPVDLDASGAEIYPGISALAVSPLDGQVLWAGSDDGRVHVTTDGGKSWSAVRPPALPAWSWISSIQPSYRTRGAAYLTAHRYMWDDFHPYIYKTADFGRHWTALAAGLPRNAYLFDVRQDPRDPDLLLLGTSATVYASFNAGRSWRPLSLNLPVAQVRGIAFNPRQGQVAIATHGRAFWVLDNLSLLEQMTRHPVVRPGAAYLFAPERAWLTHAYGSPAFKLPAVGQNPPFGATLFFHIPANYRGRAPVTLSFFTAGGQLIRRFPLHLAAIKPSMPKFGTKFRPTEMARLALQRQTGIRPGMNRFQWDLRYAPAAEVRGFEPPIAAGGEEDTVSGPLVTPGAYRAVLDYGGRRQERTLQVALDPRLHASPADLQARLALALQIHSTLDRLDRAINRALVTRRRLRVEIAQRRIPAAQAAPALRRLEAEIGRLVQLNIHASEASLLYETRLRSHLAYLAADVELAFTRPSPAQFAVFRSLAAKAAAGERALAAAQAQARPLLQ